MCDQKRCCTVVCSSRSAFREIFSFFFKSTTLLETNIFGPENGWLEDEFPLGFRPIFRGELLVLGRVIDQLNLWVFLRQWRRQGESNCEEIWTHQWKEKMDWFVLVFFCCDLCWWRVQKDASAGSKKTEVESLFAWKTISWWLMGLIREKKPESFAKQQGWEDTFRRKIVLMMKKKTPRLDMQLHDVVLKKNHLLIVTKLTSSMCRPFWLGSYGGNAWGVPQVFLCLSI